MSKTKPTFTKSQLTRYFDHIKLPNKYYGTLESNIPLDASLLTALHVHQIAAIPYDNLSLHYSQSKTVTLHPRELFAKFIEKGCNRGGYCMEVSLFFLHVLLSLGFDAYPTGVRLRLREDGVLKESYTGLVHIALIITLPSGEKYVSDVAFGGDGPTMPLPLSAGVVSQNLGSQEVRFVHEGIPQLAPRALGGRQQLWIYQYRNSSEKNWDSFYCFTETEFLDGDFNVMNFWVSHAQPFQRTTVLVVKFFLGVENEGEDPKSKDPWISSKLMLVNGTLKRNLGGKTEVVKVCRTEEERVMVLRKWFHITLTDEEQAGIKGKVTELKDVEVIAA